MPGTGWKKALPRSAFFVACLVAPALLAPVPAVAKGTVRIKTVIDGDSVILTDGREVRLIGINAPEPAYKKRPAQPVATEAARTLRRLTRGKALKMIPGHERRDRRGRLLAHLRLPTGKLVTAEMLRRGMGFHITIGDNTRYLLYYQQAEVQAQAKRAGVWGRREYAVQPVVGLPARRTGFMRISGTITQTGRTKKFVYLDLGPKHAIHVPHRYWNRFKERHDRLVGYELIARGWLTRKGKRNFMTLTHPAMLELLAPKAMPH